MSPSSSSLSSSPPPISSSVSSILTTNEKLNKLSPDLIKKQFHLTTTIQNLIDNIKIERDKSPTSTNYQISMSNDNNELNKANNNDDIKTVNISQTNLLLINKPQTPTTPTSMQIAEKLGLKIKGSSSSSAALSLSHYLTTKIFNYLILIQHHLKQLQKHQYQQQ